MSLLLCSAGSDSCCSVWTELSLQSFPGEDPESGPTGSGLKPREPWSAREHDAYRYGRHRIGTASRGSKELRRGVAVPQVTPQARTVQNGMPVELLYLPANRSHWADPHFS